MNIHRRISSEKPTTGRVSALSMYEVPPTEPISVSEFEEFAFDRLRRASHCTHTGVRRPERR